MLRRSLTAFALVATLGLAACESAEDKAEGFYQSGLELLADGDMDRAMVAFRNVFRYDGQHFEARKEMADILFAQSKMSESYSQYLRLAEQYPENVLVRQKLATMALIGQAWADAERHGRKAIELDPEDPPSVSILNALEYREAALAEDDPRQDAIAEKAQTTLAGDPQDIVARRILIAHYAAQNRPDPLLEVLEPAIEQFPADLRYHLVKLRALSNLRDEAAVEAHLQVMYTQFPDNDEVQRTLITFYLQRQNYEGAERFLRQLAGPETADPQGYVAVLQLIERAQGRDAAKAEMRRMMEVNTGMPENVAFYQAMLAGYDFEDGNEDVAIAAMQDIVDKTAPGEQTRRIKGTLANMFMRTGNRVGARALLEEILVEDSTDVNALKMRAQLLIQADQPADAIRDLRVALDQSPRDLNTLILMAAAHERNGSPDLQGERLSVAVEVSGAAPRESLLYADFLIRNNRREAARSVLDDARNASPRNPDVLVQAARLALADNALGVVRGIIADLEKIDEDPRASEMATTLRSALLLQEDRSEEGLALLQEQAGAAGQNSGAVYAVIQTQLRNGELDAARSYIDGLLENAPEDENLLLINAALFVAEGNPTASEQTLRDMIERNPQQRTAVGQLYVQLRRQGRVEDARAVLQTGLDASPNGARLLQYQAGELEAMGDMNGAIAIYRDLYERNSSNVTVANNLASLLSTFRDDPEDLRIAVAAARRLRGTDVPAFQDTYGWIAYRQGNYSEALEYLVPAAENQPNLPLVQYHLGMTYLALQRKDDARTLLERAIELAGPETDLPQMQVAREKLDELANE